MGIESSRMILRHSGIRGAADEAVLNNQNKYYKNQKKKTLNMYYFHIFICFRFLILNSRWEQFVLLFSQYLHMNILLQLRLSRRNVKFCYLRRYRYL
jgi:hypothetical protein